ncbi:MAG: SDR family oxidoreductase [Candidatus Omnitrophica bacterium]|nr:SDR family oxidoreductase [Candidatus Omnitrophota bacterium]
MKVLVTGGAGYAGSIVSRLLLAQGHRVRVLDSLLYGGRGLLGLYHQEDFHFLRGDIRERASVEEALKGMEAVVHLAALVGDPACSRRPELAREINLEGSLRLFEAARRSGIKRFIYASTCSNYGKMRDPSQYLTEDSELRPVSLYAQTKVSVEERLLASSGNGGGPAVTVLRFATLYGLSPRMRFDLTVNEFTMELMTRRKVTVYGEQFWRPYLHLRDAARAVLLVLTTPAEKVAGQAFNVGDTGQNFQKGRLVEMISSQVGGRVQIERVAQVDDPRDYRVSFEKAAAVLGFRITRTVEGGIQEIMEAISQGVITDFDNSVYRN